MKKFLAVLLALMMVATLSVTVFAETIEEEDVLEALEDTAECDVDVKIDGTPDTVYYVTVEWESLDFTYAFDENDVWNPLTHAYENDSPNWVNDEAVVTTTNHSNVAVAVTLAIDEDTANGVTATLSDNEGELATGENLTYETADALESTVTVSGVPTIRDDFTIGTVTVTIADAE